MSSLSLRGSDFGVSMGSDMSLIRIGAMDFVNDSAARALVSMIVVNFADHRKIVHHKDAVRERDHFRHVAGNQQDRDSLPPRNLSHELMEPVSYTHLTLP